MAGPLTGKDRPRVCLVMTASGDDPAYLASMYSALAGASCDVDHLALFTQPNRPVPEVIGRADLVWVGGGSVANLLALWRLHQLLTLQLRFKDCFQLRIIASTHQQMLLVVN